MPPYARLPRFDTDCAALSAAEKRAFKLAVSKFVADLSRGAGFRPGLRVKGVQGSPGIFEMTWADNGRATFQYGPGQVPDEPHVVWRRVGSHAVFVDP